MTSKALLQGALLVVRRAMRERGFSSSGAAFFRRTAEGNSIVLAVQKRIRAPAGETQLTINYGIYSARIGEKLQEDPRWSTDVMKAHWRRRLSHQGKELWLSLKPSWTRDEAGHALVQAVDGLLPELGAHESDAALRDEWLSGISPGITDMQRLLFASVLVAERGPAEQLESVVQQLRSLVVGTVHEALVEGWLARAGVRVST